MGIRLQTQPQSSTTKRSKFSERFDEVCGKMDVDPDKSVVISFVKGVGDGNLGIVVNELDLGEELAVDVVAEELAKLIINLSQGNLSQAMHEALIKFAQMGGKSQEIFVKAAQMYEIITQKMDNIPFMDPSDTFRINN